jgi:PHD/YefM family antitoxin component YafN of YafNO toxin-antitoxin module
VDEETYHSFSKRAKAENRTLANFIENAVKVHIREQEFADDLEMAEILANENLVERLKAGSRDAKRRRGTLVG